MQEDHAKALLLAKQSVVQVDPNGDAATASAGDESGKGGDGNELTTSHKTPPPCFILETKNLRC